MEFLQSILGIYPAIKGILLAIIPLGFLIFIHELGHFLAAKRCGVKVNTFSLGFGPKLIGFEHGGTDYRLSLLPFGGYVQMEGETPGEQTGAEDEFASASVGDRSFIVIAGPVVNLLFGILAYWLVFSIGLDYNSAELVKGLTGVTFADMQVTEQVDNQEEVQIGWMAENSPAIAGGLLSGDVIVSINGENVNNWVAFRSIIFTSPEKELEFVVKRDGNLKTLTIVPDVEPSARGDIGKINVTQAIDVFVYRLDEDSLAANAGLQVGDRITTINGEKLYDVPFFEPGIWDPELKWLGSKYQALYQDITDSDNLELGIERYGEKITLDIPVHWQIKTRVQKGSTADKVGIMNDDVLISFDGKQINSKSLYTNIQSVSNYPFELGLLRNGTPISVTINPEESSKNDAKDSFFGIEWNTYLSGMKLSSLQEMQGAGQVDNQEKVQIGWIAENSPAIAGGLLSGDVIVSINGENVNNWVAFRTIIFTSPEKELEFVVKRDGNLKTLTIVPDVEPSARGDIGKINVTQAIDVIVYRLDEDSLAANAGLQVGDKITTINGEKLYDVPFFEPGIWNPELQWFGSKYQALYQDITDSDNLELGIERYGEKITLDIPVHWQIKTRIQKGSTADKAGIMDDDVLITFDGKEINSESLYTNIQSVSNYPFELGLLRNGTPITVTINPEESSRKDKEDTFFGIRWNTYLSGMKLSPLQMPLPKYNLIEAGGMGLQTTWLTFTSVAKLLKKLVSGQVSPKFLSGPVGIGTMTSEMFDRGIGMLSILFFVGFISINLCIVNLLPIPITDGGQLLFLAIEKIRGRTLPQKAQAIIQQVSVGLLLALFIYITWYDILSLIDRISG